MLAHKLELGSIGPDRPPTLTSSVAKVLGIGSGDAAKIEGELKDMDISLG